MDNKIFYVVSMLDGALRVTSSNKFFTKEEAVSYAKDRYERLQSKVSHRGPLYVFKCETVVGPTVPLVEVRELEAATSEDIARQKTGIKIDLDEDNI